MHPVLDQEGGLVGLRQLAFPEDLEVALSGQVPLRGAAAELSQVLLLDHRRKLVVVADQHHPLAQRDEGQGLLGAGLVGLVEEGVGVLLAALALGHHRLVAGGGDHALVAGAVPGGGAPVVAGAEPEDAHPGLLQALGGVVDRPVGVRGDEDPGMGLGLEDLSHRLHDHGRLTGPRRALQHHDPALRQGDNAAQEIAFFFSAIEICP